MSVISGQSGRRQCTLILSHSVLTWELRFFSLSRLFRLPNGSVPFIPSIPHRVMNDSSLYDWHCSMNSFNKQINITFHYIILKHADEWCVAHTTQWTARILKRSFIRAFKKIYIYIIYIYYNYSAGVTTLLTSITRQEKTGNIFRVFWSLKWADSKCRLVRERLIIKCFSLCSTPSIRCFGVCFKYLLVFILASVLTTFQSFPDSKAFLYKEKCCSFCLRLL